MVETIVAQNAPPTPAPAPAVDPTDQRALQMVGATLGQNAGTRFGLDQEGVLALGRLMLLQGEGHPAATPALKAFVDTYGTERTNNVTRAIGPEPMKRIQSVTHEINENAARAVLPPALADRLQQEAKGRLGEWGRIVALEEAMGGDDKMVVALKKDFAAKVGAKEMEEISAGMAARRAMLGTGIGNLAQTTTVGAPILGGSGNTTQIG